MRVGLGLALAYFAIASLAHALERASSTGWRSLSMLSATEQMELTLAWRASLGEWVGRDLASERGPLRQLVMWAATAFGRTDPAHVAGAESLVFPLASLALVLVVARRASLTGWARVFFVVVGAIVALHLAEETVVSLLGLTSVLLVAPPNEARIGLATRADLGLGARSGALLAVAVWLAPAVLVPALASIVVTGLASSARIGAPRAWARASGASLALLAGAGALSAFSLSGGDPTTAWRAAGLLAGDPLDDAALAERSGLAPGAVLALAWAQASVLALALWQGRPSRRRHPSDAPADVPFAIVAWIGALPFAVAGIVRGGDHAYVGLVAPLLATLIHAATPARRASIASWLSALVVVTFVLAWSPRFGARTAWRPSVLAGALATMRRVHHVPAERGDLAAVAARLPRNARCVLVPGELAAGALAAGVRGPIDPARDRTGNGEALARAIVEADCPSAVAYIASADRPYALGALGFGPDLVARAERYAPDARIGPALFLARRAERSAPAPRAIAIARGPHRITAAHPVELRLPRSIPAEHILRLFVRAERVARASLRPLSISVAFFDGETPIRGPMRVPLAPELWLPVEAERAEWRWIAGRDASSALSADRVRIAIEPGAPELDLFVDRALELAPPPAEPEELARCAPSVELARVMPRAFARHTLAPVSGDELELDPNRLDAPSAEVFVPVVPCADACLAGEVGIEGERGAIGFEVHLVDGPERPRILDWTITPGWRRPFELPLAAWRDRAVLVRFATRSLDAEEGVRVRVYRPRIRPCASLFSIVHALHDSSHRVVRGAPGVSGDVLAMPLEPRGEAPVEVRVPMLVPERACLALTLRAEPRVSLAATIGVVREGRMTPLIREVFRADEASRARVHAGVSLERWTGMPVELYLAAWPLERGESPGRVEIVRPRVHRCGERADWAF